MILSDRTIREEIEAGRIVIDPFDPACVQPSSVDLHVDSEFRVFANSRYPYIDVKQEMPDLTELVEVKPEESVLVNGLTIRPVPVSHIVPTTGFIVEDRRASIGFSSDTGPTHRFWELVNNLPNLKAVITETSFPNELQDLAQISGHLTPQTLDAELEKLKRDVPVYLYGGKPKHLKAIKKQVAALKRRKLAMLEQGKTYKF